MHQQCWLTVRMRSPPSSRSHATARRRGERPRLCYGMLPSDPRPARLDRFCRVDRDLVVGLVARGQPQVEVLDLQVHIGKDELRGGAR